MGRGVLSRECLLSAAIASGLAVQAFIERLPRSLDFILPRGPGFRLFESAVELFQAPAARRVSQWGAILLIAAAVFAALARWFAKPRTLIFAAALAVFDFFIVRLGLDVIQNVWFMPESLSLLEPLAVFVLYFLVVFLSLGALSGGGQAWVWSAALVGFALALFSAGRLRYDLGRRNLAEAAGIFPEAEERTVLVLGENGGVPEYWTRSGALSSLGTLRGVEAYCAGRSTGYTRMALRFLYDAYARRLDAEGLRRALWEGHLRGDPVARVLLLGSLQAAPAGSRAARMLGNLADEERFHFGPAACAELAKAYWRQGDFERASRWEKKAGSGIPAGLFSLLRGQDKFRPGAILGRVRWKGPVRAALFARRYFSARRSYSLAPEDLVDSVDVDSQGKFEFKGLPPGDYYLALSLSAKDSRGLRLRGHKGDVRVTRDRPNVDLPALELYKP